MPGKIRPEDRPTNKEVIIHQSMLRDRDGRKDMNPGDKFQVVDTAAGPRGFVPDGERSAKYKDMIVSKVVERRLPNGERVKHYHLSEG